MHAHAQHAQHACTHARSYTAGFFGGVDAFLDTMPANVASRDMLSPQTKLAVTEVGCSQ